ncbi:HNH endonuclease domain-containing protein [Enterobacter sp. CC120223-11]|uniref:HNH endonuclease domain-containing protein n=1 Tax=Enterobacter sp. CC120223-11 TaxID=1378073 RepID=UPI000BC6D4ED|nr:HNH endonuclease domain-containing protein [Enterobacter sp. CC120223-11]SNY68210.1 HNH endonuclease [Enterobacter sp. CC120223-11]
MRFYQVDPVLENYWRGIILFGKNVASYKFALASALYDLKRDSSDLILLEDLAVPFSEHLCRHLQHAPKQITSKNSQYLAACAQFNANEITPDELRAITVRRGFNNVIDAFHIVNNGEIEKRFFIDERKTHKGIRLTENFHHLTERPQFRNLIHETDARWNLVEQAWAMGVSRNLIAVEYGEDDQQLFSIHNDRRVAIASCRDSLNGYQKGHCFYCYAPISLDAGHEGLADVDHFIPWMARKSVENINGVWNLVLACKGCNRGKQGKFAHVPSLNLLKRLHSRNEYFINSHLPLRETLIRQTGKTEAQRSDFLNKVWNTAQQTLIHQWEPQAAGPDIF